MKTIKKLILMSSPLGGGIWVRLVRPGPWDKMDTNAGFSFPDNPVSR